MLVGKGPKNRLDVTRLSASAAKEHMAKRAFVQGRE
jgi:hypothetical protein